MKRRWISLLLTGTLVLGSLAMSGCGNSSDSGDADTDSVGRNHCRAELDYLHSVDFLDALQ